MYQSQKRLIGLIKDAIRLENHVVTAATKRITCAKDYGTEQICIFIKTGYMVGEKTINEVISEHDLAEWVAEFKSGEPVIKSKKIIVKEILEEDAKQTTEKTEKPNLMSSNNEKPKENENNFDSMRSILFESMRKVNEDKMNLDKAKAVSLLGQTIINSAKVENEFLKLSNSKNTPSIYQ